MDTLGERIKEGVQSAVSRLMLVLPDLSHACGWHRPAGDRSPAHPNPGRWYVHGAAQNRRGTVLKVSHIPGAPSFSPSYGVCQATEGLLEVVHNWEGKGVAKI